MIDPEMNPWDTAALIPIVQEAGGHFTDWTGTPTIHGGKGLSAGAALKEDVLGLLNAAD